MTRSVVSHGSERVARADRTLASAGGGRAVHVLVGVLAVGVVLPLGSTALGVYDHVQHWGKLVHAVDGACATFIVGMLLFGWRDRTRTELADELATLLTLFAGMLFGVLWEIVEFAWDWVASSDLQKSNTDTMTDFLWGDLASIVVAQVVVRAYLRVATDDDRARLGMAAEWLVDGPSRLLDRHGLALSVISSGLIAATVLALWFSGRPVPGLPIP